MPKPYVLNITEKGGSWSGRGAISQRFETEEQAEAALLNYVEANWDTAIGTDRPEDPDELIEEYFENALEGYQIWRIPNA